MATPFRVFIYQTNPLMFTNLIIKTNQNYHDPEPVQHPY